MDSTAAGHMDIPEYVDGIRHELAEVREKLSNLHSEMYPSSPLGMYMPPDPIREMQYQAACSSLYKEEERLMAELRSNEWIIPALPGLVEDA